MHIYIFYSWSVINQNIAKSENIKWRKIMGKRTSKLFPTSGGFWKINKKLWKLVRGSHQTRGSPVSPGNIVISYLITGCQKKC